MWRRKRSAITFGSPCGRADGLFELPQPATVATAPTRSGRRSPLPPGEPLPKLGVMLQGRAVLELATELTNGAEALGQHIVAVNRFEGDLARENEVAVVERGIRV